MKVDTSILLQTLEKSDKECRDLQAEFLKIRYDESGIDQYLLNEVRKERSIARRKFNAQIELVRNFMEYEPPINSNSAYKNNVLFLELLKTKIRNGEM